MTHLLARALIAVAGLGFAAAGAAAELTSEPPAEEAPERPADPAPSPDTGEPPAADAPESSSEPPAAGHAHGYISFGLLFQESTQTAPFNGERRAGGAGVFARGLAHSAPVTPSIDIVMSGLVGGLGRKYSDTDEEVGDSLFELDGGMRINDVLYVSGGYTRLISAYRSSNVTFEHNVLLLAAGYLKTHDTGYILLQARGGRGGYTNDYDDESETVAYAGLRVVVHFGFGASQHLLLGMGLDRYEVEDLEQTEDILRAELGLGFGI